MTPQELKALFEERNIHTFFFTRDAMRFFGDTMKNFGVCSVGNYWQLFRKKPVAHGRTDSFYFHKETLARANAMQVLAETRPTETAPTSQEK